MEKTHVLNGSQCCQPRSHEENFWQLHVLKQFASFT